LTFLLIIQQIIMVDGSIIKSYAHMRGHHRKA
jgi:hypothetical protein